MDNKLQKIIWMITVLMLSSCSSISIPSLGSMTNTKNETVQPSTYHFSVWEGSNEEIWEKLQHTSSTRLNRIQTEINDPVKIAWIQLALISKHNSVNTTQLVRELIAWRDQHPSH